LAAGFFEVDGLFAAGVLRLGAGRACCFFARFFGCDWDLPFDRDAFWDRLLAVAFFFSGGGRLLNAASIVTASP
jgi:hypothetical protein